MSTLRRFLARLGNVLRPGRSEPDLAREVAAHLSLLEDDFVRRGLTPEEARLAARRAFGGVEQTKELHRDARSFVWLDDTRRDLQYAVRVLRRAPGYTAAIVLTLAVGMGANTAIFSVISGVVLRPLGYPDADRLLVVLNRWTDTGKITTQLAGGDEIDIRASQGIFEAFARYQGGRNGGTARRSRGVRGDPSRPPGLLPRVRHSAGGGAAPQSRRRREIGGREPRLRAAELR